MLTGRPDITIAISRGHKAKQQQKEKRHLVRTKISYFIALANLMRLLVDIVANLSQYNACFTG